MSGGVGNKLAVTPFLIFLGAWNPTPEQWGKLQTCVCSLLSATPIQATNTVAQCALDNMSRVQREHAERGKKRHVATRLMQQYILNQVVLQELIRQNYLQAQQHNADMSARASFPLSNRT